MLKCTDCGEIFDEDEVVYERVCWEDYYGVSGMLHGRHYGSMAICPHCGSDEIEECWEDDDEE